ncbi:MULTISPECIES: hypothetical protein [unclassified Salinibacterium]|nr:MULTISPECIES: hypothetical protein [unclassified Salinibacterium]
MRNPVRHSLTQSLTDFCPSWKIARAPLDRFYLAVFTVVVERD